MLDLAGMGISTAEMGLCIEEYPHQKIVQQSLNPIAIYEFRESQLV